MQSSCFYYGALNESGIYSLMCGSEFNSEKNIAVDGFPSSLKQRLFGYVKAELKKQNVPYVDFCIADGSGGVFCERFKIIDSDFCDKKDENFIRISSGEFVFSDGINQSQIELIQNEKEKQIQRAQRFISACRSINRDVMRLEERYMNKAKLNRFCSNLWRRITNGMKGHVGTEKKRLVSCLTPDGSELNMEAFDIYCEKMLVVNDRTGLCSGLIADRIRGYALGAGYDVISCPCSIDVNRLEHLIIPELSFGIFTSKYYHRADFENSRKIYSKRFMLSSVDEIKFRADFSLKAYRKLMDEVFVSLEKVKESDLELDEIYRNIIDEEKLFESVKTVLFD